MARAPTVSCFVLCALAAAALSASTCTTCEAFAPTATSSLVPGYAPHAQSITGSATTTTALNAQKKRRRKRKVASPGSDASGAAAPGPAAAAAEPATPSPPKLDAAAELKAAEMAFDLGADGFVGEYRLHCVKLRRFAGMARTAEATRHV